jgi:hypothetical protein
VKSFSSFALAAVLFMTVQPATPATSTAWESASSAEFLKGKLTGLVLTADGVLVPGPAVTSTASIDQPVLWTAVSAPDGVTYVATGHRGKVYRVDPNGTVTPIWTAAQPEVFALCVDSKGVVYAASSPQGSVYRLDPASPVELFHPEAKYIWAILPAPQGGLYIATGDQGRIYYLDPSGKNELYFETGQQNVTSLALGAQGQLYAGSEPNGLLFEITAKGKGTILFDSTLPEIRGIAVGKDGAVYASALGGSLSTRSASQAATANANAAPVAAASPTVISVSESAGQIGGTPAQVGDLKKDASRTSVTSTVTPVSSGTAAQVVDLSGVEKSAIYRINSDRTVDTLRTSKEENVYDLLLDGDRILFSTDQQGRIYALEPDHKVTLLAELGNAETIRLMTRTNGFMAAQSTPARLMLLNSKSSASAAFESPVHDCTTVSRWGRIAWRSAGSNIVFRTRTGNAARPDTTWSDWSTPLTGGTDALIPSPNARYIQWRAEWSPSSTTELSGVTVSYLPQNTAPIVRSISVSAVAGTNVTKAATASSSTSNAYSVTVTDTGDAPSASTSSTASQSVSRGSITQTQVTWQAEDPDGDKLMFSLYFRGEGETQWKLVRSQMFENSLLLDPDVLADGRYWFRVVASDRPSNAKEYARETELISPPVLIDNTPPLLKASAPRRHDDIIEIDLDAEDASSPLRRCEYAVDAGPWQPIEAADGVTDSPKEAFDLRLDKVKPGEHLVVFRVYDSAGNAGLLRVVVH